MKRCVAVIGVGNMGGAIAANLLERGWAVRVRDIRHAAAQALQPLGAELCASAAAAAQGAQIAIVCVVDAPQLEAVLFEPGGIVHAKPAVPAVLLCPTVAPEVIERCAQVLHTRGIAVLEAPMSGGPARARQGTMSLMVACAPALRQRYAPLLQAIANPVFDVGARLGDGARTKLVNNALAGLNLMGAAEALTLARALGLDLARTLSVIEASSGQSWIGSERMRRALSGDLKPRAHISLLAKDTAMAAVLAEQARLHLPLCQLSQAQFAQAQAQGWADQDDAALLHWLGQTAPQGRGKSPAQKRRAPSTNNTCSNPALPAQSGGQLRQPLRKEQSMAGKFELKKSKNGKFHFNLLASNGQVIMQSEMYEAKSSALNGIESVRKNAANAARYAKLTAKNGSHYFTLKAGNHQVIGQSQMYASDKSRDAGIASCQTNGAGAKLDDQTA